MVQNFGQSIQYSIWRKKKGENGHHYRTVPGIPPIFIFVNGVLASFVHYLAAKLTLTNSSIKAVIRCLHAKGIIIQQKFMMK